MARHDHFNWVGQVIDAKYRVDRAVDEGTFGVVYQAHHLKFDEKIALKCLKLPKGLQGATLEEFCRRFVAEGRFLHRLSRTNANIVQALDVGAELGPGGVWVPYLVLEWLEGVSLAEDLEHRANRGEVGRGLAAAVALLSPAALALGAAHEQRVAHCDVKPANLFLTEVGGRPTLKVLDFGIAQFADEQATHERATGEALCAFSPFYAAPEQFDRACGATGPWTDVFSLALVLVEVASGRAALEGQSIAELFRAAAEGDRPTLRARGVACSDAAEAVVRRALSPRPGDRFANALEFWQALGRAAGVEALGAAAGAPSSLTLPRAAGDEFEPDASADSSGAFRAEVEGAAASTGAHPASAEGPSPIARRAATPGRSAGKLGSLAALASGAALALAVTHRGPLPGLHVLPSLPAVTPLAASLASGPGSRPLARPERAPAGALPTPDVRALELIASPPGAAPARPAAPEGADDFTVRTLGREASLDYAAAARECARDGLALCTEAQWQLACDAGAPLGASESWTASDEASAGAAVRGGAEGCRARRARPASQALRTEGQACCAHALVGALPPQTAPASFSRPAAR